MASKPPTALSGLRKGSSKTLTMTYNAIKSLTLSPTLQLQTDGQRSARLTVQKNPSLAATGPTGHPYMTVRDYAAPVGWRSSDPAVCTVDGTGLVSAVSRGTATVTASVYGGKVEASCKVAVDLPVDDNGDPIDSSSPVSYTHLVVYKRQGLPRGGIHKADHCPPASAMAARSSHSVSQRSLFCSTQLGECR